MGKPLIQAYLEAGSVGRTKETAGPKERQGRGATARESGQHERERGRVTEDLCMKREKGETDNDGYWLG